MEWTSWNTTTNVRFGLSCHTPLGELGLTFSERQSVSKPGEFTSRVQLSLGPFEP